VVVDILELSTRRVALLFAENENLAAEGWGVTVEVVSSRTPGVNAGATYWPPVPGMSWPGSAGPKGMDVALMVANVLRYAADFDVVAFARMAEAKGLLREV
jgi:hypothetical protein